MEKGGNLKPLANRENHGCFGCSSTNAHGLRMKFFADDASLYSWLTVPNHLCGWDTLVHGGVIATILDETMGWTAIHFLKKYALTQSMNVEFLKPVQIGVEIRVEGKVTDVRGKREAAVEGYLYKGDNTLCAKAKGVFRLFTAEAIIRLGIMGEETISRFDFLIDP
jgi:uncharacterized protein (TIGR00369 family)